MASALTVSENSLDDPDQQFYENYVCGAERNYTGYCDPEVDKLVDRAVQPNPMPRSGASSCGRSSASWPRTAPDRSSTTPRSAYCSYPYVKNLTIMVNSNYNGWRFEDVWLDR